MDTFNYKIDADSNVPIYKQVAQSISSKVRCGDLLIGDKIPSEQQLMKNFHISRVTVRAAIAELVDDGMLVRSQGKGTFVAQPKEPQMAVDYPGLTVLCKRAGKKLVSQVLFLAFDYTNSKVSRFLNISENDQIIEIRRLRMINDAPTLIETCYFLKDYSFLLDSNLSGSLFKVLSEHGLSVSETTRSLEIAYASAEEARILQIKKNAPLLLFRDYHKDQNGNPFYVSKQLYNTQNMIFYL